MPTALEGTSKAPEVREGPGLWDATGAWYHVEHHRCSLIFLWFLTFEEVPWKQHARFFPAGRLVPWLCVPSFLLLVSVRFVVCHRKEISWGQGSNPLETINLWLTRKNFKKTYYYLRDRKVNVGHLSRCLKTSYCLSCCNRTRYFKEFHNSLTRGSRLCKALSAIFKTFGHITGMWTQPTTAGDETNQRKKVGKEAFQNRERAAKKVPLH